MAALIKEEKVRYISVLGRDETLFGLAYAKDWKRENYIEYLAKILSTCEDVSFNKFFKEYWNGIEVHIWV